MKLDLIILDFDGTIADTFSETVKIFNAFARKYGYRVVEDHEIESARCMNVWQLLKFVKVPRHKVPFLLRKGRAMLYQNIDKIPVFEGIPELLNWAEAEEIPCGIITSNSKKNVEKFIRIQELPNIHFIVSSSRLLGKSREFKRVLKKRKVNKHHTIYIGDETRDIEAAHESGVKIVSVTWGYNSKSAILQHNPDFTADTPESLMERVESFVTEKPAGI